jgi:hypothetical protein
MPYFRRIYMPSCRRSFNSGRSAGFFFLSQNRSCLGSAGYSATYWRKIVDLNSSMSDSPC